MKKQFKVTKEDLALGKTTGYGLIVLKEGLEKEYFQFNTELKREWFKQQLKDKYSMKDSELIDKDILINNTGNYDVQFYLNK